MGWLNQVWTWLKKLPLGRLLKPLWKGALVEIVQTVGDDLQKSVKKVLESHSEKIPGVIDSLIDSWQRRIISQVDKLRFLPASVREKIINMIQEEGDHLQETLKSAEASGGGAAIDRAFDVAQAIISARIEIL